MSEETAVVESSATIEAPVIEIDRGPLVTWTPEQRTEFRKTGNMPEPPQKDGESATPDTVKEPDSDNAGESETPTKPQERIDKGKGPKPHPSAEERIAELESTIERIRKDSGLKKTPKTESSPVRVEPQPQPKPVQQQPQQQQQVTRTKPTAEDTKPDGSPKYATYEDFVEELADWKAEQRWATAQREQQQQAQAREFDAKIQEAKGRYENFDEVMQPAVTAIMGDQQISPVVKTMLNDSEVLPALIYTIGSNQQELDNFLAMAKNNPGKALRYIALTESLINEELESKGKAKAEPKHDPPVKPQTSAPKPPAEVGGRNAAPSDALESAAQAGDFRQFKAESTRRYLAKLKGLG